MQPYSTTSGHSAPVRKRYPVLDCLRGILLLNMIAYHFLYDWVYIFGQNCTFMHTRYAFIWQQIICSGFILLAGCCSTLSRHAAKHGIRIFLCGMLITLVTTIAAPNEQILFGILHFTGLAYCFFETLAHQNLNTGFLCSRTESVCLHTRHILRLSWYFSIRTVFSAGLPVPVPGPVFNRAAFS